MPTQYKEHNNTEDGSPFLSVPLALSLKEKGHRGVGGLSVGEGWCLLKSHVSSYSPYPNQPQKRQPWC